MLSNSVFCGSRVICARTANSVLALRSIGASQMGRLPWFVAIGRLPSLLLFPGQLDAETAWWPSTDSGYPRSASNTLSTRASANAVLRLGTCHGGRGGLAVPGTRLADYFVIHSVGIRNWRNALAWTIEPRRHPVQWRDPR